MVRLSRKACDFLAEDDAANLGSPDGS